MQKTPKGLRLQIGIFGKRNAGKSSIFNRLTHQEVSIVSDVAGTTTDPVEKAMEVQPIGPVLFVDTAGIDDIGALGEKRVAKTMQVITRVDLAILVVDSFGEFDQELISIFKAQSIPCIVVANKSDIRGDRFLEDALALAGTDSVVTTSAIDEDGIDELRATIIAQVPDEFIKPPAIAGDLVPENGLVILVTPIDKEAPKGRLILPQVQTIRDLLDHDIICMVVKETELKSSLAILNKKPDLVITDSQAFKQISRDLPDDILMTGFSVLFSRFKGDLNIQVEGALAIEKLRPGSKILIAEACSHHPIEDDIGREKIPRLLEKYIGGKLNIAVKAGRDYPDDVSEYDLIIHCGACVWNRREMLSRIIKAQNIKTPITNYGLAIAYTLGIFERALKPFADVYENYQAKMSR